MKKPKKPKKKFVYSEFFPPKKKPTLPPPQNIPVVETRTELIDNQKVTIQVAAPEPDPTKSDFKMKYVVKGSRRNRRTGKYK